MKAEVSCYTENFYEFIKLLVLSPKPRSAKFFVSWKCSTVPSYTTRTSEF